MNQLTPAERETVEMLEVLDDRIAELHRDLAALRATVNLLIRAVFIIDEEGDDDQLTH